MPTVMLTTHCPNACEWCFARPKMEEYRARGIHEMSWKDFTAVVDFYERSGLRWMALLGGEPTWHSRFVDILKYLYERRFAVLVVTTGILPGGLVNQIADENFPNLQFAVVLKPINLSRPLMPLYFIMRPFEMACKRGTSLFARIANRNGSLEIPKAPSR